MQQQSTERNQSKQQSNNKESTKNQQKINRRQNYNIKIKKPIATPRRRTVFGREDELPEKNKKTKDKGL